MYADVCSATSCGRAGAPAPEVGCKKHRATAPTPSHQGDEEEEMCSRGDYSDYSDYSDYR